MGKQKKRAKTQAPPVNAMDWAKEYLADSELKELEDALQFEIPISIRINSLKSEPEKLITSLTERYGWKIEPVPFCNSGFWIHAPEVNPSSTIEHRMGYYYIQEAASMLPAELFDFDGMENPLILDMAASPGGKTIHLIDRTHDRGLVIANDASRSRIPALRVVLENWGAIKQGVTCQQGKWFGYALPETFDAVLLDAPCSMQGLRASASHNPRPISESEIQSLADRQVNLLMSALQSVKTGGEVVYSTCTLSPQENEGVLAEVMERCGAAIEVMDIGEHLLQPAPGIDHIGDETMPEAVARVARLWPHIFNTAGFFSAKLQKVKSLPEIRNAEPETQRKRMQILTESEAAFIFSAIEGQFGLKLEQIAKEGALQIVEADGKPVLAARRLVEIEGALPLVSFGIALGKPLPDGWQPSHMLVSRFGDLYTRNIYVLDDIHLPRWMRGEDIRGIDDQGIAAGSVVVVRDSSGRNLGRGKVLKDRLKNQLPTRLF